MLLSRFSPSQEEHVFTQNPFQLKSHMQKCTLDKNQTTTNSKQCLKRDDTKDEGVKPLYTGRCQAPSPCVQCCRVRNGDPLSRKRRASRGRIALPRLPPCLPVTPPPHAPSIHQTGPSEQLPGGFLSRKKEEKSVYCLRPTCLLIHVWRMVVREELKAVRSESGVQKTGECV